MASLNMRAVNPLPPGWDCKYDNGRRYYINYLTRHTSVEDPRVQHPESIPLQDLSANTRLGLMMGTNSLKRQQSVVETSQTTTDQSVAKISAVFPTVTETHIRTLLLKYLKSVFPVVEETVLLDTLSSSDNNVHRATQTLLTMGFDKHSTPPPRVCLQRAPPQAQSAPKAQPPPRMKSIQEKEDMKVRLRAKHPQVAERVVSIALDSVDFDEAKADQILTMAEDTPVGSTDTDGGASCEVGQEETCEIIIEEPSQASSPESPPDVNCLARSGEGEVQPEPYRSALATPAHGPNPKLVRGPNQALLLPDYVAWTGSAGEARGPDPRQREGPRAAQGPNPSLRKGPRHGLARGSLYTQLAGLSVGESRGK